MAALSAIFPRAVDLNSVGRGSNPHAAANFLGLLAFIVAAVPSVLIVIAAGNLFGRPALVPVLLVVWCAICAAVSLVVFGLVAALFERRRENLLIVS
jgi:hypothetical protein